MDSNFEITGNSLIGFEKSAEGRVTFRSFNSVTNAENPWVFVEATREEVNRAVALASNVHPVFKETKAENRAKFLRAIADEMEALGDELLEVFCNESGLHRSRAAAERNRTTDQLRMFADHLETNTWRGEIYSEAIPDRLEKPRPELRKHHVGIGPVVVFGASNFPFAYSTVGGDTASALAAGCPVIVKSHPMHAGTGELVADAVVRAAKRTGIPEGVFSNLNAIGYEVGEQLVTHPNVKGVGFTGSIKGGRAIFDIANRRPAPIPVFAEMGSTNPVILLPSAIKQKFGHWLDMLTSSICKDAGQFCTNPGLLIGIQSNEFRRFQLELAKKLDNIAPIPMLHPNIREGYETARSRVLDVEGVERLTTEKMEPPVHVQPTLARTTAPVFIANALLKEEVFGAFTLVIECDSVDRITEVIRSLHGQLTGTVIAEAEDYPAVRTFVQLLEEKAGRIIFNGVPTGVEVVDAMFHGGPYPASTDSRYTAVGVDAIKRWLRPVAYQNFPEELFSTKI